MFHVEQSTEPVENSPFLMATLICSTLEALTADRMFHVEQSNWMNLRLTGFEFGKVQS